MQPPESKPAAPSGPADKQPQADRKTFRFDFRDAVDLSLVVDAIRDQLGLQIIVTDSGLQNQKILLQVPVEIPNDRVLRFLTQLLELKGWTLTQGESGIYFVHPVTEVLPFVGAGDFNATRIIPTRGLKPTALQAALGLVGVTVVPATGGAPVPKGTQGTAVLLDELGVILVTGTPRITGQIADLVERLAEQEAGVKPIRFELRHVSGSYARERVLELTSTGASRPIRVGVTNPNAGAQPVVQPGQPGSSMLPFDEKLTVDPQGNALYFRGRPDEVEILRDLLAIIDVSNPLQTKFYAVGAAARAIANEGQKQGLGDVTVEEGTGGSADPQQAILRQQLQLSQQGGTAGPGFVIYPDSGGFVYRGTTEQHARVTALIQSLSELTSQDSVVIEFYKLKHSKSEDVAEIVHNLLTNQLPSISTGLLQTGARPQQPTTRTPAGRTPAAEPAERSSTAIDAFTGDQDTFVLSDKANNQVLVKARKRLQPQFARLIEKIDLRRPQVYVDVKIVAITATDSFRLAFETQLMSANGAGGVVNTNFGLGSFGTTTGTTTTSGSITDQKDVVTNLLGLTSAYIRADQVPIIIHALAQNVETRIVSSPQLLVDDNEEAKVDSVDRQPFAQTTQSTGNPLVTSFGQAAEAGTKLRIKPQISEGDYLKIEYEVELSSFTGQAASPTAPPPSQVNTVSSKSVTVPSDTTIVVGGLTFEQASNTVFKVPLLGDIPIVGQLFRDERKDGRKGTLYVFITPRIMKDPAFADTRLLTRGPMRDVKLPEGLPSPEPVRIDILEPARSSPAEPSISPGAVRHGSGG